MRNKIKVILIFSYQKEKLTFLIDVNNRKPLNFLRENKKFILVQLISSMALNSNDVTERKKFEQTSDLL